MAVVVVLRLIIDDWVTAITERRRPLVTFADAAADLAVVLAAAASLRHGGDFVDVADFDTGPC